MDAIRGMDFLEPFRFEKEHLMVLLDLPGSNVKALRNHRADSSLFQVLDPWDEGRI